MPAESAILAHAPDLAPPLFEAFSGEGADFGIDQIAPEDRPLLQKAFQLAEATALVSLSEESLWNDYALIPALRDDFVGDEMAKLGQKVLRPDGRVIRDIRDRALQEATRLAGVERDLNGIDWKKPLASPFVDGSPEEIRHAATARYLEALTRWVSPILLPHPLKKRVLEDWYPRFGAALRSALKDFECLRAAIPQTAGPDDRRFDELNRQSWRLDEIFQKLDKWVQANPDNVSTGTLSATSHASTGAQGTGSKKSRLGLAALCLVAFVILATAFWIAFSSSPRIESYVAQVQSRRVTGLSERIARAAAQMDAAPIPNEVFLNALPTLQDAGNAASPISSVETNAAFLDLQRKQLCRQVAGGWIFHESVRSRFRPASNPESDWWRRSLAMLLASAPEDEESPANVDRWRMLLPHFIAIFELAPDSMVTEPPMQSLLSALSRGLLANRIEPGRRPPLTPDAQEPDDLHKRISVFVEAANKYFEQALAKVEAKYGRFSSEMVTAHRLLAELSWRTRELKKEQDSWVRASRALEKQEIRDAREIAFCHMRLGISRAIASDQDGAEEAFAEALNVLRERYGAVHPQIGRTERKIARVYADLGQFQLAWVHHQRALVDLMKSFPVATPEIAALHEEQADFLIDHRNFKDGIGLLERGVEVWKTIEYPTSPEIARAQGALATAKMLAGQFSEAEQSARARLELLRREYGSATEPVWEAEIDLAMILLDTFGADGSAKAEEVKALLKPRIVLPPNAPFPDDAETALVRCLFARSLVQTNHNAEAITHFDRGFRVLLNTQPRPNLVVAGCYRDYGQALIDTLRKPDARKMLGEAETELSALSRLRPRYLRITSEQIEDIRQRISRAQ
jgi:hypothetical protein